MIAGWCGVTSGSPIIVVPYNKDIESKIECIEYFTNCVIKSNGEFNLGDMKVCLEKRGK